MCESVRGTLGGGWEGGLEEESPWTDQIKKQDQTARGFGVAHRNLPSHPPLVESKSTRPRQILMHMRKAVYLFLQLSS